MSAERDAYAYEENAQTHGLKCSNEVFAGTKAGTGYEYVQADYYHEPACAGGYVSDFGMLLVDTAHYHTQYKTAAAASERNWDVAKLDAERAYYQADDYTEGDKTHIGFFLLFNNAAVALRFFLIAHGFRLLKRCLLQVNSEDRWLYALYQHDDACHPEEVGQRIRNGDVALQRRSRRLVKTQGCNSVARRTYDSGLRERACKYSCGGAGVQAEGLAQPDSQPRTHNHKEKAEPDNAHTGVLEPLDNCLLYTSPRPGRRENAGQGRPAP